MLRPCNERDFNTVSIYLSALLGGFLCSKDCEALAYGWRWFVSRFFPRLAVRSVAPVAVLAPVVIRSEPAAPTAVVITPPAALFIGDVIDIQTDSGIVCQTMTADEVYPVLALETEAPVKVKRAPAKKTASKTPAKKPARKAKETVKVAANAPVKKQGKTVPETVLQALRAFRDEHGRTWKSKLRDLWMSGKKITPELQHARNVIGPSGLDKVKI